MTYAAVRRWCVKGQIIDLQGLNNVGPWARAGPTRNPQMKASTKGIYLRPRIKEVHHYESDYKSPVVKYLYRANCVNLSSEP